MFVGDAVHGEFLSQMCPCVVSRREEVGGGLDLRAFVRSSVAFSMRAKRSTHRQIICVPFIFKTIYNKDVTTIISLIHSTTASVNTHERVNDSDDNVNVYMYV